MLRHAVCNRLASEEAAQATWAASLCARSLQGIAILPLRSAFRGFLVPSTPGRRSNVASLAAADGTAAALSGGPLKCPNPTGGVWGRKTNPANPLTVVRLATGDESRQMRGWSGWEAGPSAASKCRELVGRRACSCGGEAALLACLLLLDSADQLFRRAVSCIVKVVLCCVLMLGMVRR